MCVCVGWGGGGGGGGGGGIGGQSFEGCIAYQKKEKVESWYG